MRDRARVSTLSRPGEVAKPPDPLGGKMRCGTAQHAAAGLLLAGPRYRVGKFEKEDGDLLAGQRADVDRAVDTVERFVPIDLPNGERYLLARAVVAKFNRQGSAGQDYRDPMKRVRRGLAPRQMHPRRTRIAPRWWSACSTVHAASDRRAPHGRSLDCIRGMAALVIAADGCAMSVASGARCEALAARSRAG
jgi:hypothetical protein